MQIHSFILFLLLTLSAMTQASTVQTSTDESWNGDLISEPQLADYRQAYRTPGILVEPYDIIELDGAN